MGVQSLPLDVLHIGIVKIISDQGKTEIFHVDADLVRAAGFQAERNQAVQAGFVYDLIMGDCRFSVFKIHHPLDNAAWFAAERCANGSGRRCQSAPDNGQIFPVDFSALSHFGQNGCGEGVFGDNGKAGRVPIQTVAAAKNKGFVLPGKIPGQSICQRIVPIVKRGMYGHTGWLVDHKQILVLEEDIQRKRYRTDIFGGFILLDSKNQQVSCLHRTVEKNTLSVYQNAVRHPLQARQIAGGKAFVPEKLAYANGLVWCCDRILDGAVHSNTGLLCVDIGKAAAKFFKHVNETTGLQGIQWFLSVEATGFEPAASASRTQRSTKLSHASSRQFFTINRFNRDCKSYYIDFGGICQDINFFFLKFLQKYGLGCLHTERKKDKRIRSCVNGGMSEIYNKNAEIFYWFVFIDSEGYVLYNEIEVICFPACGESRKNSKKIQMMLREQV